MSLYPENPEIGEVFNNRQWSGTAWVALNNPLSVEYTTDGEFTQHTSASANVHGIINSASVVYADDAKLSDERAPLNQSVTDSKIVAGGLSASVITGTAVVTGDARLSDQRTPLDNSVTSAKIVSGTIVDEDISASAAITPTKIFGTAIVDNDLRLTNDRTPTDGTVTDAKIFAGGLSASVISGSAVVQNDLDAYLTQSSASSTYLTQTGASATYAPSASPIFTGTVALPLTTNYDGTQLSSILGSKLDIAGGKILQIVRATDSTNRSTTSTSFVDVTGMSVTITPQFATSKIIVLACGNTLTAWSSGLNGLGRCQITDSGNTGLSGAESYEFGTDNHQPLSGEQVSFRYSMILMGYSEPNSTSAQTYKLRFRAANVSDVTVTLQNSSRVTGQMYAIEVSA
jgi:hypothetical protein